MDEIRHTDPAAGHLGADCSPVTDYSSVADRSSVAVYGIQAEPHPGEPRLRLILEQVPAVIWTTDRELVLTSVLGSGLAPLDLRPEQLVGRSAADIARGSRDAPTVLETHRRALEGESATFESEWGGRMYDNWIEPLRGADGAIIGCLGLSLDVTERKEIEQELHAAHDELEIRVEERTEQLAEANEELHAYAEELRLQQEWLQVRNRELNDSYRALEAEQQRYQDLFDFAPDGYLVTDLYGVVLEANRAACELLGLRQEFLIGKPLLIYGAPEERRAFDRHLSRLRSGVVSEIRNWDMQVQPRDHTPVDVSIAVTIVSDAPGQVSSLRWLVRDVSERKRAEAALKKAHDELEERVRERTAELERSNQELQAEVARRVQVEEALRRSLDEAARSRRLLLALSQAARAVQRARTIDEVYQAIEDEVRELGYDTMVFILSEDRAHLAAAYVSFGPAAVRAIERLLGCALQDYRFPLQPHEFYRWVIAEGKTVFSAQSEVPLAEALPPPLRSQAGRLTALVGVRESIIAPLRVRGETMGLLIVTGAGLAEADVPAVNAFADQAAVAIENAQLLAEVGRQKRELEKLSVRLIRAQDEERERIARELHDEMGQSLTAMSINLAAVEKGLPPDPGPSIQDRLAETHWLIDQTLERVRALALHLRPGMLDDLGLVPTLRWYLNGFAQRLGIEVEFEAVNLAERMAPELETALYRVIQEALTNVARHAQASKVRLHVEQNTSQVLACIQDDGKGFDVRKLEGLETQEHGVGLLGMRERVASLGGDLRIESEPGRGTRLFVELPLRMGGEA
jgi:PAS domain S-box-containing protein